MKEIKGKYYKINDGSPKDTYILIQGTCEYVSYMSKEWTKDGQFPWRWDQGCYSADLKIER